MLLFAPQASLGIYPLLERRSQRAWQHTPCRRGTAGCAIHAKRGDAAGVGAGVTSDLVDHPRPQ